jgi:hypothetical protein
MTNEIAGFGGGLIFLKIIILSELIGKCVLRFGRLVRNLKNQ